MLQFIDVTKDIQLDQQKQESRSLEITNATVSHELRNPLNSIIGFNLERNLICEALEKYVNCDMQNCSVH